MKTALAIIAALLLAPAGALGAWDYEISSQPFDQQSWYFAVGATRAGVAATAYTGAGAAPGPLKIAHSDGQGRDWRVFVIDHGVRVESGAGVIPSGDGVWVATEAEPPGVYHYRPGEAHVELIKSWAGTGYQYLLGDAATAAMGYVIASEPLGVLGACVARIAGCSTGCVVPPAFDPRTGRGLIGWAFARWRKQPWIAGQIGLSREHGRLLRLEAGAWVDAGYVGPAIVQISLQPDGLMYLGAANGVIYRYDGSHFEPWFTGPPDTDIRIIGSYAGRPVIVSAAGAVFHGRELAARIPGRVGWMSLVQIPGQDVWAGTLMFAGQPGAWGVRFRPEE